jgi:hypothetical protein
MNCDDPRSPQSVSNFYSSDVLSEAKCSLCFVAAFCVRSVECVEGVSVLEDFIFIWLGKVNVMFSTERQQ